MTLSKFYKTILFVPYNITVAVVGAQLMDVAGKPSERTATHDPTKLKLELVCPKIVFRTLTFLGKCAKPLKEFCGDMKSKFSRTLEDNNKVRSTIR